MKNIPITIDRFISRLGKAVAWLSLVMTLATFCIVILRYGFEISATPIREAVVYFHGTLILLGVSFTLQADQHVRVDLFYSRFTLQKQAVVNLVGSLFFLIPVCVMILIYTIPYVHASWRIFESSAEVGGLPGVFLLKTLLPISAGLLLMHALNNLYRYVTVARQSKDA